MSNVSALRTPTEASKHFSCACDATHGQEYNEVHEMETKVLIDNDYLEDCLLESLRERRSLFSTNSWTRMVYSAYYDTEDLALSQHEEGLRIRYNDEGNYEISSKGKATPFGNHGVVRFEPEARTEFMSLDLPRLFESCQDNPQAIDYLVNLVKKFDNQPESLKEALFISCDRKSFNACVHLVTENGRTQPYFANQLHQNAKIARPVYFEFSLDRCEFYAPGIDEPVHSDTELEWEFKSKPCFYAPKHEDFRSAPDLTMNEIMIANGFLAGFMESELGNRAISWHAPSKFVRGLAQKTAQEEKGLISPPKFNYPTVFGVKLDSVIKAPEHYFIKHAPRNENVGVHRRHLELV